ncbi:MAG: fibronectin type III domain-containing protein, partial [bacterium]|nr:fibronectin type III domain-containing protein [bacterium]
SQYVQASIITTLPNAPTQVKAVAGNAQATVSWLPPENTGGQLITDYFVYSSLGLGCQTQGATSCVVSGLTNGTPYTFRVTAANATDKGPEGFSNPATPGNELTVSSENLALSGLGNGAARTITITNNSSNPIILSSNTPSISPDLPTGTSITNTIGACTAGATIGIGNSCTVTVNPGSLTTSDCNTGSAPTPSIITVQTTQGSYVTANVVFLGYGCQYQQGYVYSIDDTTPLNGSIGGKIVALNDQGSNVLWSSNNAGTYDGGISIYGTAANSTPGVPIPDTSPPVSGQLGCNGNTDGACDTTNIIAYYSPPTTTPQISFSFYASGLCKQIIAGYDDWYLPAICEMGYDTKDPGSEAVDKCGTSAAPTIQNMQ